MLLLVYVYLEYHNHNKINNMKYSSVAIRFVITIYYSYFCTSSKFAFVE